MEEGKFGEIRKAIKLNRHLVSDGGFIRNRENNWGIYDSDIDDFAKVFAGSLPLYIDRPVAENNYQSKGEAFRSYVEGTLLESGPREFCAVELGGPGSRLFQGFSPKFFKRTAGVCLTDTRDEFIKAEDRESNHNIVTGNIFDTGGKLTEKVKKMLRSEQIDLIISKMEGPLRYIDLNDAIMDRVIRDWYSVLREGGLIFIQFAYGDDHPQRRPVEETTESVTKWAEKVMEKFPEIDIQTDTIMQGSHSTFRLHKRKGSPVELPKAADFFAQ